MRPSNTHYQTIFRAIPVPAFVVDDDVKILDLNCAASVFSGQNRETVYERRVGEVFHCLHSTDVPEGCGRGPRCNLCVLRNAVTKCMEGQTVSRKVMNLPLACDLAATVDLKALITASPLPIGMEKLALLMVEEIMEGQRSLYNIPPLQGSPIQRQQIGWNPRPRTLGEFPPDTQIRLRQLEFDRTIAVSAGEKGLYVKRVGFNQFLCCDA